MPRQNVLVFPSATYPAMQIIDCLKNSPRFHVIAGASYPNHAEFVCEDAVTDLPYLNAPSFWDSFLRFLREKEIRFVIPTDETAAMVLKEREAELPAAVVCSPYPTTKLCRYKSLTYRELDGEPYVPKTYRPEEIDAISDYPIFLKPDSGQGSRGAMLIADREQLRKTGVPEGCVLCEYLPGTEYTVDCFTDKNRNLLFCNPRVRTRLMNGITARGHDVPLTPEFSEIIHAINRKIVFRGYWYVQLKRDRNEQLKLLEICTRFAGSFAISKGKGVNLPLLALCDFSGLDTAVIQNDYTVECDKTYIDRYKLGLAYSHVYVDYDDTVTMKNGTAVNPYVIAFLYQCRYKGIRLTLLTRHQATFGEALTDSMDRLSLSPSLFDEVIELNWDAKKRDAIGDTADSIFLDNSFQERKEIHDACGIPVFDITNMDCLFDWKF